MTLVTPSYFWSSCPFDSPESPQSRSAPISRSVYSHSWASLAHWTPWVSWHAGSGGSLLPSQSYCLKVLRGSLYRACRSGMASRWTLGTGSWGSQVLQSRLRSTCLRRVWLRAWSWWLRVSSCCWLGTLSFLEPHHELYHHLFSMEHACYQYVRHLFPSKELAWHPTQPCLPMSWFSSRWTYPCVQNTRGHCARCLVSEPSWSSPSLESSLHLWTCLWWSWKWAHLG